MKEKKYQRIVERHKPKEERAKFALISFIVGGLVGLLGEGLICFYVKLINLSVDLRHISFRSTNIV